MRVIASFVSFSNRSQVPVVLDDVNAVEIVTDSPGDFSRSVVLTVRDMDDEGGLPVLSIHDAYGAEMARIVMPYNVRG